ncbi:glycosyl transferase family 2 [Motilibacter rhizosphaerae]|uniref:Glycosyl transferase family 2 n=1 Tax=Motilibacter rhizosphaerae TaxID=598652 RepID=A0A4Q7NGB3_9ACTN|nr:glycosyltransferase [Motilibacter rhizosphaerae]RZS82849.1 glycosyl transferase family 2 [Motilibacter rhizosphaerae]
MSLPSVTALVTVHQVERYVGEALDSALAQDYPEHLLDVVVVDDGSTDGSAGEVARRVGSGRVRVVRQANAGYVAATNRAVAEATGTLLAVLDADDVWPTDKVRRQVEALGERSLLYGDMTVIDRDGRVLQESWLEDQAPPVGDDVCGLLRGNVATSSSLLLRADAARRWGPVPVEVSFADWWFALRAALEGGLGYLAEPRTGYRFHGENMSLGTQGPERAGQLRASMALQRWFLRRLPERCAVEDVLGAWQSFADFGVELMRAAESPFVPLVPVSDADRAAAVAGAEQARALLADGRERAAAAAAVAAAAADPWCAPARTVIGLLG